ncbi:MAG: trypsin-like peptidase domain-containing protein [Planctomycetaceae bacterium]|nr:trypsin-like peptidase domain-containing protein [Planctomycetaceae bacterium]
MKMLMLLMLAVDGASTSAPDVQLLDFSAGYCGPCQQMVPILQQMETAGYPIRKIDITEDPELARRFKVDRIPTFVLLVEGQEVERFVGLRSGDELRQAINKAAKELSRKRAAEPAAKSGPAAAEPQFVSVETEIAAPAKSGSGRGSDAEPNDVVRPQEKRSLGDMFRRMIGKGSGGAEAPSLRGQDPASNENASSAAFRNAFAATVRIRVAGKSTEKNEYLQDVGTGTIVHSTTGRAIVLTCAHLFQNIQVKEAVVEVDVFEDGKAVTYPAKLVGGDHDADLAFLQIRTSKIFPAVRLSSKIVEMKPGQALFSIGCNDGADPTRLNTKLVDINRYHGPPNFVCSVDPASGRSGGGLFSVSGELLGVCSCADRETHEGLYAAHGAILELMAYLELDEILTPTSAEGEDPSQIFREQITKPSGNRPEAKPAVAQVPPATTSMVDAEESSDFVEVSPDALLEVPDASPATVAAAGSLSAPTPLAAPTTGPEITIVIDDKTPGSTKRVIVIPQASAWMLEMLTGETAADSTQAVTATLRPVRSAVKAGR